MSYQPRSTNPYIMEKKLNNCVGGGGFDPSVLEKIETEISILGSENATMAQDIIDIKGSLNSINDNLNKHTISDNTKVTLSYNTRYTTLVDGYFTVKSNTGAGKYVNANIDQAPVALCTSTAGAGTIFTLFCRKGSIIKYGGSADADTSGFFYPLA